VPKSISTIVKQKVGLMNREVNNWLDEAREAARCGGHLDLSARTGVQLLTAFPAELADLTNVKSISVAGQRKLIDYGWLRNCPDVEELDLGDCGLLVVPREIRSLAALNRLKLNDNPLREVEDIFDIAMNLFDLDISRTRLRTKDLSRLFRELICIQSIGLNALPIDDLEISSSALSSLRRIEMNWCRLLEWPSFLSEMFQIRSLSMCNNKLTNLPDSISSLTELCELDLSGNRLTSIAPAFGSKLTKLHLAYNHLSTQSFPRGNWPLLRSVDLCGNKLTVFPEFAMQCECLETLRLRNCELAPANFSGLYWPRLKQLDLSCNDLRAFPQDVNLPNSLVYLNLERARLSRLPEFVEKIEGIDYINLSYNSIHSIGESARLYENAKEIILKECSLRCFPKWVYPLSLLRTLDLSGNPISSIHIDLSRFSALEELCLQRCQIRDVTFVGKTTKLKHVNLQDNELETLLMGETLPRTIRRFYLSRNTKFNNAGGLKSLTNIMSASLAYTSIRDLSWNESKSLEYLDLSGLSLPDLNREIARCPNLQHLILNRCEFAHLPTAILGLEKLESLEMKNCNMITVPNELFSMPRLQSVCLDGNNISHLLITFRDSALRNLSLVNCSLSKLEFSGLTLLLDSLNISLNPIADFPKGLEACVRLRALRLDSTKIENLPDFSALPETLTNVDIGGTPLSKRPEIVQKLTDRGIDVRCR
jgi:Leucine-rich repeat (LRR) protein